MRKAKPIRLTFAPWSPPKSGRVYKGRVKSISDNKKCICVTVENLDDTMAGRLHRAELLKNLHPGNRTYRFAVAAGLDIETLGAQIDLRDLIGHVIGMRFYPVGDAYEIEFEKVDGPGQAKHGRHDSPQQSDPSPTADAGGDN